MANMPYEMDWSFEEDQITDSDIWELFESTSRNGGLAPMFNGICAVKNGSIADRRFVYVCEHPPIDSTEDYTWGGKVYKVLRTTLCEAMKKGVSFELEECAEAVPLFDLDDDGDRIYDRNKFFVFDNGDYVDRYSIVFPNRFYSGRLGEHIRYESLSASQNPFHPQGIGLNVEARLDLGCEHLGALIEFDALPEAVRLFISDNLETDEE